MDYLTYVLDNLDGNKDYLVCRQNANHGILFRLFIVVDILSVPISGWHLVQTISTCFGILSES